MIKDIASAEEFDVVINNGMTVVQFGASWCAPCKQQKMQLERAEDELNGIAQIVKVDVDENPDIAQRFSVMSVPTVVLFKDGNILDKYSGMRPKEFVIPWVKKRA